MLFLRLLTLGVLTSLQLTAQPAVDTSAEHQAALRALLGDFPTDVPLDLDTLERVAIAGGTRLKVSYTAELPDTLFNTPIDRISAYLFVPDHAPGKQLPAVVAIHQDGPQAHLGKSEPAGLAGADDMYRFYHAERRRIVEADTAAFIPGQNRHRQGGLRPDAHHGRPHPPADGRYHANRRHRALGRRLQPGLLPVRR